MFRVCGNSIRSDTLITTMCCLGSEYHEAIFAGKEITMLNPEERRTCYKLQEITTAGG